MEAPSLAQDHHGCVDSINLDDSLTDLLCCCSLLNETLGPNQHLPDCELQFHGLEFTLPVDDNNLGDTTSDACSSAESVGSVKGCTTRRRKHRESMARLRHKLRQSIGTLQLQEQHLARTLQRTVAEFQPQLMPTAQQSLQQAYFELLKEQFALEEERRNLEETWIQKDKYERLVMRELLRIEDTPLDIDERPTSVETVKGTR